MGNLYVRRVLSGEFVQVNKHLVRDLIERKLWTEDMRMQLIAHNGSVQHLDLPADVKQLYKTVWEIKQRIVLDMASDRGAYIDQSQSLNIHMIDATDAVKFTVDVDKVRRASKVDEKSVAAGVESALASSSVEEKTIASLKANEPKYACVGCSS